MRAVLWSRGKKPRPSAVCSDFGKDLYGSGSRWNRRIWEKDPNLGILVLSLQYKTMLKNHPVACQVSFVRFRQSRPKDSLDYQCGLIPKKLAA